MEEVNACLEASDFEGAEDLLSSGLAHHPRYHAFFHYQFGRVYSRWNKLSSAVNHLNLAVEITGQANDEVLMVQVLEELRQVRERQLSQRP